MKLLTWKAFIALLPVLAVSAAWIAWDLKFVPLLDTYKGQGSVLEKQFDRLDRKITSGEITRRDAIKKLKTTVVTIQEADEKFMMSIKTGMIFLFLAIGIGAVTGTIRIIFLGIRDATKDQES